MSKPTYSGYTIQMHDGEFYLCREKEDIGILFISPHATLEQARQMIADLNSVAKVREMLCEQQAENAALRDLLRQCETVLSMIPTREPAPGWMKLFVEEYVSPLVKKLR